MSDSPWDKITPKPALGEKKPSHDRFMRASDRMEGEREERLENAKGILSFGVSFLDAALGGICKHDLILIGAKSGLGKTQLAMIIAMTNSMAGKRVHYFALEAEKNEIERRLKFARLSIHMRNHVSGDHDSLNYLDWHNGRLDRFTNEHEPQVEKDLMPVLENLNTFYRTAEFSAESFFAKAEEIKDHTDLIVLDHVHYVDSDDANENRGIKNIVKMVRDVSLGLGKPVVMVAHVRKGDRNGGQLVPGIDDFMGSSDIAKIATKAIMIAPAMDMPTHDPCLWPTYIAPVKCRPDGQRTRYSGVAYYDVRGGIYAEEFSIGKFTSGGTEWKSLAETGDKVPRWAMKR